MKFRNIIIIILLFYSQFTVSQSYNISGFVEDLKTGERIIGAHVIDSISKKGAITNNFGFFSFKSPGRKISVLSTYVGCVSDVQHIVLIMDTFIILKINPVSEIKEVEVFYNKSIHNENSPLGLTIIPVKNLISMPALGEPDLLKSIQNQPGIKGGVEGSAGIFVRGGGGGENLFLLDDVPIYNVSHLYGFFSAFNNSAVKDIKVIKGCFPSRYGGRVSSVIDVRSKDGNNKSFAGDISVGIISSKFTFEGPVNKNKTTFLISARRSYFDLLSNPFKELKVIDNSFPDYYFYDLNLRIAHSFNIKNRLYLSLYKGTDFIRNKNEYTEYSGSELKYTETREETSGWGNFISSLRWNHAFGNNLFANATLAYSKYNYFSKNLINNTKSDFTIAEIVEKKYSARYNSEITDIIAKIDFDYSMNDNILKFGIGNTYHTIYPGKNEFEISDQEINEIADTSFINNVLYFNEPFIYLEMGIKSIKKLTINAGFRLSGFDSAGIENLNSEPRISANYILFPKLAIKAGYSRMVQYMHLLSSYGVTMPTDLWVPAKKGLKPLRSDQITAGLSYTVNRNIFITIEAYQKWLINTADYLDGASLLADLSPWYTRITQGKGVTKGLEFSIEKQEGRINGMISYTLAKADRKYTEINKGKSFPFKYDRLHDLSISANYQFSEKFNVSALFIIGTGYPITLPVEKYLPALGIYNLSSEYGGEIEYYPSRNNYRLPVYHRMDIGIHYKKQGRIGEHNLSFDIFNVYNRKNPVYGYYSGFRIKTLQYSYLLSIIPSITYTLKFNKSKKG